MKRGGVPDAYAEVGEIALPGDLPARTVGRREVVGKLGAGKHHVMTPTDGSPQPPPRIVRDVAAQRIRRVARLLDGVDRLRTVRAVDHPAAIRLHPYVAALDFDHHDPRPGHERHQVGLMVLVLVGHPIVRQHHTVVAQLLAQPTPHVTFGRRRKRRPPRYGCRHAYSLVFCRRSASVGPRASRTR